MNEIIEKIENFCIEELMGDAYGEYAKETIQDRAIPDVRDGLKPVQRRILFAMYKNGNTVDKPYRKAATTVGDVLGKYHPHGDSSVYEALARMSQDWKQRHILIDFKGNNGSIDGDSPAAYRYTETRLSKLSNEITKDIDKDTVKMTPNFDDTRLEPTVMPCRFPNLLVNGTTGISTGYATNIPPHNLGEIIDATIKRIDNPNCRLDTIMEIVKGPDFPTGGIVYGKAGLRQAFETGRGKLIVRGTYETIKNKGKTQIVITEIPFDLNKTNLVSKIADIKIDKKIDGIAEVSDLSDVNGLKIVIELKSGANSDLIINYLLKNTDLQTSYNYNMVTIVNRRPKLLGILGILDAYIAHQKEVVIKRTKYDLQKKEHEKHILEGLIKALDILDEIIKTIRASKNKSDSKNNLIEKYSFTEIQAEAIVTLQLYRLSNTDVNEVKDRLEQLIKEIAALKSILASEDVLLKVIKHELKNIKKEFDLPRITKIEDEIEDIKIDVKEMVSKENVVIVVTNDGYVKRVSSKSYAAAGSEETTLKPGDFITGLYEATTLDTLLLFTNFGQYLFVPIHTIFEAKWKEMGKHISNLIPISPEEKIINSIILDNKKKNVLLFTKNGLIKKTCLEDFEVTRYSKPLIAIKLKDDDELINVVLEKEHVIYITNNGYYLKFNTNEVNPTGTKAAGVKGINLKSDFVVNALTSGNQDEYLNIITNNMTAKRIKINDLSIISRAKKGNLLIKKVKSVDYKIINAYLSDSKDEIGIKSDNEIITIKNSEIPIMDLASTGSNISKYQIDNSFPVKTLISYLKKKSNPEETIEETENNQNSDIQELTIDDFIDDFKL